VPLSRFADFMLDDHPVDGFSPAAAISLKQQSLAAKRIGQVKEGALPSPEEPTFTPQTRRSAKGAEGRPAHSEHAIFELLYNDAAEGRAKREVRRLQASRDLMASCTFSPEVGKLSRWERVEALHELESPGKGTGSSARLSA